MFASVGSGIAPVQPQLCNSTRWISTGEVQVKACIRCTVANIDWNERTPLFSKMTMREEWLLELLREVIQAEPQCKLRDEVVVFCHLWIWYLES